MAGWQDSASEGCQESTQQDERDGEEGQREVLVRGARDLVREEESQRCANQQTYGDDKAGFEQKGAPDQRTGESQRAQHADLLASLHHRAAGNHADRQCAKEQSQRQVASQQEGEHSCYCVDAALVK